MTQYINLIPYDPSWLKEFESEKDKLLSLIGDIVVSIEHIGSTSISGIHAKPIIDILIGMNNLEKFNHSHIEKNSIIRISIHPIL